jgi:hypothetical protein
VYLWLGQEEQDLLLPMKIRPFLSHKRQDRVQVERLKRELQLRGAGGWRDLEDLPVGTQTADAIRKAIRERTAGFVWYGTKRALESWMVNNVELPTAIERARGESGYPFVPLFVNITPEKVRPRLVAGIGEENAEFLLNANGLVRGRSVAGKFVEEAARRYLYDAASRLTDSPIKVGISALREPTGSHDLTLDWGSAIDQETRVIAPRDVDRLIAALIDVRNAVQRQYESPHLVVDLDLPLPLAVLAGYHWRLTTRICLDVRQRLDGEVMLVTQQGGLTDPGCIASRVAGPNPSGPVVIAVSCRESITGAASRYCETIRGAEVLNFHHPGDLTAAQIRSVVREVARTLTELNDAHKEKHLLLRGPASLALLVGASMNAAGPTVVPLWNGSGYGCPVSVGPATPM